MKTLYKHNKSVGRGLKIIELISEQGALTDQQISSRLNYNLLIVQQLLCIYMKAGYLVCDHNGTYDLSIKIIDISRKFKQRCELKDIAHNHLKNLSEKYNETTTLGAIEGTHIVYIDKIDSLEQLRFVPGTEQKISAHHTASGKAILAYMPQSDLMHYCHFASWDKSTYKTISSQKELFLRLYQIKKQGFAICNEEFSLGLRSVAVAILDSFNYPRYAIGLWGPVNRMTPKKLRQIQVDLTESAIEISKYYSVTEALPVKKKIDTRYVPLPENEGEKETGKSFFRRAVAMFL